MGLEVKGFRDILKGMVDWTVTNTGKLTDFTIGSVVRTLYEAIASEIEQFYFIMKANINWAIENAIFESFGFKRIEAQPAYGEITLTFYDPLPEPLYIPKGTKFATVAPTGGQVLYFETREDYRVAEESVEATLMVYCTQAGTVGNVAANSIRIMTSPIRFVESVTNRLGFNTGKEAESAAERKQRFNRYIDTLAKGTVKSLEYGCKEVPGVEGVFIDESEIANVVAYVHDADGNLPDDLKAKVEENLINYRAAGIHVEVKPIEKISIDVDMTVKVLEPFNTEEFKNTIVEDIYLYLNSFPVSKPFYVSDLIQLVRNIDNVGIVNCKVNQPTSDIIIPLKQIIRPNNVTVTLTI